MDYEPGKASSQGREVPRNSVTHCIDDETRRYGARRADSQDQGAQTKLGELRRGV